MSASEDTYAYRNARAGQDQRLRMLEALLDPGTIRHLEAQGVGPGWRCLEVGAGGGSIAAWLCDRVGPEGRVVATDLDTTVLRALERPNLEVRVHDVLRDDLEADAYDLVHLRLLLGWLADPGTALRRLAAALKPGGRLVAEEMDFVSVAVEPRTDPQARAVFERYLAAHHVLLPERHAFDVFYGRRVAGAVADAGLADVGCEGRASMWRSCEPGGEVWRLSLEQLADGFIEAGLMTRAEVDAALDLLAAPGFSFLSQLTMAAWGRRPPARS